MKFLTELEMDRINIEGLLMNGLKWIMACVLMGALLAGGWWYWKHPGEKLPDYRTAPVSRGEITQSVTASGQLNPVVSVQVGSQISGMIQRLYVDFNSSVTQGQLVAEIDASTYRAALHQSEGNLANVRAALELTQINARRASELLKDRLIPQSDYDKAMADLHQAEAQVMINEATLEKAHVDLNRCTISAPTNGIVISRSVDVGQTVAASLSAPTLFVIANDLSRMQIDAMVSEADIGGVDVNQEVRFTVDAFPSRPFLGRVRQIRNAPSTNQNVVSYDAVVTVENRDLKLKPGMTANASIVIAQKDNLLKIPNAALRFKPPEPADAKPAGRSSPPGTTAAGGPPAAGDSSGRPGGGRGGRGGESGPGGSGRPPSERFNTRVVYLLPSARSSTETNSSPGQLRPQKIKIGISDGAFTEVTEGLQEGDTVVVGLNITQPASSAAPANPFGGGPRRF